MKKSILFFCLILVSFACSSDDDSGKKVDSLSPPSWIVGEWRYLVSNEGGLSLTTDGYNFLSNDVCEVYSANILCFKNTYGNEENFYFKEYKKNSSEYKFSYTRGSVTKEFYFKRNDENKMSQLQGVDYSNAVLEKI